MPQTCSTNYTCTPVWYDSTHNTDTHPDSEDVIIRGAGPYTPDNNIVCDVGTGNVKIQVKNKDGEWFTPSASQWTIIDSDCVRLPRANMPDVRIIASGDAEFHITGSLG